MTGSCLVNVQTLHVCKQTINSIYLGAGTGACFTQLKKKNAKKNDNNNENNNAIFISNMMKM